MTSQSDAGSRALGVWSLKLDLFQSPAAVRYGLAFLYVCLASWLRWILVLDNAPFLLYMPGMFVIGFLLGQGPGFAATLVSAIASDYIAFEREGLSFWAPSQIVISILFILICGGLVLVCDALRTALLARRSDLLSMSTSNASLMESQVALEESEAFLRSTLESSPDCIKVLDLDAKVMFMNGPGRKAMDVVDFGKIEGCPWPDFWHDEYNEAAGVAISQARAGITSRFQGQCLTMAGVAKWWDVVVAPIRGSDGQTQKLLSISRDITEQKRAEAQQRLLNHELAHRMKNTLAMVQAIANQTLRRSGSIAEARNAFEARLIALGKAQDLLIATHWESAELHDILRNALAPHGIDTGRFSMEGPDIRLSSRCSLALSLALHELATNAAKYGALSVQTGRVLINWTLYDDAGLTRMRFEWKEHGGPAVAAPSSTGFGSVMIERSLVGYFKGTAEIQYPPDGARFVLTAPVTRSQTEFSSGEAEVLAAGERALPTKVDIA